MNLQRRLLMLAGAAAIALTAFAGSVFAADNALLTSKDAGREDKLVEAAKAEGTLTLYTSIAQNDLQPLISPFEEKYGIKVVPWRASGDTVLQRVIQEQKAGRNTVDSVHISAPEMEALHREGMFQPIESPYFADLLPGTIP
ncbi:MAG TPA: ABC transporter substrate-binding protein, partial [Phyllobacterium sp.]|nr:ABC transporter substrate-binding protein [Phyllobacterium sp.]